MLCGGWGLPHKKCMQNEKNGKKKRPYRSALDHSAIKPK
jgi:hypothetical protein